MHNQNTVSRTTLWVFLCRCLDVKIPQTGRFLSYKRSWDTLVSSIQTKSDAETSAAQQNNKPLSSTCKTRDECNVIYLCSSSNTTTWLLLTDRCTIMLQTGWYGNQQNHKIADGLWMKRTAAQRATEYLKLQVYFSWTYLFNSIQFKYTLIIPKGN